MAQTELPEGAPVTTPSTADAGGSADRLYQIYRTALALKARAISQKVLFSCFLDEQPSELVPARYGQEMRPRIDPSDLIVNPLLRFQAGSDPPADVGLPSASPDSFLPGYPLAWVGDAGTDVWSAYWLRGEYADRLESLAPGQALPAGLPPAMQQALVLARILVPRGFTETRERQWESMLRDAPTQFRSRGFHVARHLIHPLQLAALRRYYREVLGQTLLKLGDPQVERRYSIKDELLAGFFHHQLAGVASRIAGEPLTPSYLYFASYQPGAVLRPHVDREQSEFSFSFLVDFTPEPVDTCGWPLYLKRSSRSEARDAAAADLGIGDGVLYKGCEMVHYRDPLPEGRVSTSLFFFYVSQEFDGELW